MRPMCWRVIVEDFNRRRIADYDVFEHHDFAEDVRKAHSEHRDDFDAFAEDVRKSLAYHFWSKCEWEVVVGAWPPSDRVPQRKVDVYEQVMLNWDAFAAYARTCCH